MAQQYENGQTLLGRYIVESRLGEGGMGEVYIARHAELARKRFAVKTLRPELFGLEDLEARFRREADVLASLDHPGIVNIVDYGFDGRVPVMVMELLQGETLRERLIREGTLSVSETVRVVREIAHALSYAHSVPEPVVHRDLKPENLFLVAPDARIKILDFGIAKVVGSKQGLTQTRSALGTPNYMAPEQLRDSASVDARADQFALASIAYECLTGLLAFPGDGIGGVVLAIYDATRPRAGAARPGLPDAVDVVLSRAWTIDADARFPNIVAFSEAFAAATAGESPATPRVTNAEAPRVATQVVSPEVVGTLSTLPSGVVPPTRLIAPRSSARLRAPLLLAGAVLLAAGVFAWRWLGGDPTPPHPVSVADAGVAVGPSQPAIVARTVAPTEPTVARVAGTTIPRSPYDAVRETLEPAVRRCATASGSAQHRLSVRVTWSGAMGLPQNVSVDPGLSAALRGCLGQAVASFGRIPPPGGGSVTRSLVFELE